MPTADDIKEFLTTEDHAAEKFFQMRREIHSSIERRGELEKLVEDFAPVSRKLGSENKTEVRKGAALWLLGKVEQAIPVLEAARAGKERSFLLGSSYLDAGRYQSAAAALKEAYDADPADLIVATALGEAELKAGNVESAEARLEKLEKKNGDHPDVLFLKGLIHDHAGNRQKAIDAYEAALKAEPSHAKSLFRLAAIHEVVGDDEGALELYEQLRRLRPVHVNTMINLGLMYEDRGLFNEAAECYQSVLDYFPTHLRARINLRDAQSSLTMFYDEEAIKREAKLQQLMMQPLADVSFSQRVRSALQKMGVNTVGELAMKSEDDLLEIPNFGKTSLNELREFLSGKGLSFATGKGGVGPVLTAPPAAPGIASPDVASKPLADFEWSGRIRKVFEKMGMVTVGELLKKSETDLQKNKNLGATSIKEIRRKLGSLGVQMLAE